MKNEEAVLGGGCFWCLDAVYRRLKGVEKVVTGFAGGRVANPTYKEVCDGNTGHAEVVKIEFNPKLISYKQLLDVFWKIHDPTSINRQEADIGSQYRSIILTTSKKQMNMAKASIKALEEEKVFDKLIVTEVKELKKFYPAGEEHQNYYNKNRQAAYCEVVIEPKLKKFAYLSS